MAHWVVYLSTNRRNIICAASYPLISLHYQKTNQNLDWHTAKSLPCSQAVAFLAAPYSVWLTCNKEVAILLWLLQALLVLYWEIFLLFGYTHKFFLLLHLVQSLILLSGMKSSGMFQLRINSETKLLRKLVGPQTPPGLYNRDCLSDSSVVRQPSCAAGFSSFHRTSTVSRSYGVDRGIIK